MFGFIFIFVIGGMTGVMVASVPYDLQVHDTFFVVAHFHYVLIGGAVFPLLGALYFWFPKMTGRMLHAPLGKINFWLLFVAFNATFFPMHFLGLRGMPRRVYTYLPGLGLDGLNLLASISAFFVALGFGMYVVNIVWSLRDGRLAGDNPWGAGTLEWATTSPPPSYNFVYQPVASGRQPIWDKPGDWPVVTGTRTDRWEVIATTLMDARPDSRYHMPGPSVWPFLTAVAVAIGFVGSVHNAWWTVPGAILLTVSVIGWMWPKITGAPS